MKKKVAFIIPSMKSGGAEKLVSILSYYLSKELDLYLLVFDDSEKVYDYYGKVISLNLPSEEKKISKLKVLINRVIKVRSLKKLYRFDTVVSFMDGANIINILSKGNEKVITSVHTIMSQRDKTFINIMYNIFARFLYNKSDNIIVVSQGIKNDLKYYYKLSDELINVIYNPCEINKINKLSCQKLSEEEEEIFKHPVILNVGRLTNVKRQKELIKLFKNLKYQYTDLKLVILGEGELFGDIRNYIEKLGLIDDVYILGFKKNPYKYMKRAKIYVHYSYFEGFGNVLIEAMACGVPVISTFSENSGTIEILSANYTTTLGQKVNFSDYGILVPAAKKIDLNETDKINYEEELFITAIDTMIQEKNLLEKYKEHSKRRAKDFDINNIVAQWMKIL